MSDSINESTAVEKKSYLVIAAAGETVTCENGHRICTVVDDIKPDNGVVSAYQFKDWVSLPAPRPGHAVRPCPACGAPFIKGNGDGGHALHIKGRGWRNMRETKQH
jgi:hypothetical protein